MNCFTRGWTGLGHSRWFIGQYYNCVVKHLPNTMVRGSAVRWKVSAAQLGWSHHGSGKQWRRAITAGVKPAPLHVTQLRKHQWQKQRSLSSPLIRVSTICTLAHVLNVLAFVRHSLCILSSLHLNILSDFMSHSSSFFLGLQQPLGLRVPPCLPGYVQESS